MSDEFEISQESYLIATEQVDRAVAYFRFYHFLSRLNYINPLVESKHGAVVVPPEMLRSIGYGFARNDSVFCIHLTGVLHSFFEELLPIESMFVNDRDYRGIVVMLPPVNYADYSFPPFKLLFPIPSMRIFNRGLASSKTLNFTKISRSLINPTRYEVNSVIDGYVKISTLDDFSSQTNYSELLSGILS